MKIKDLLSPRAIRLNAPAESKSQAIDALVELHAAAGNLTDPSAYKAAILAREGQGTTAIGEGIAVPHAKSDSVAHAALAAMTVPAVWIMTPRTASQFAAVYDRGSAGRRRAFGNSLSPDGDAHGAGFLRSAPWRQNGGGIY